MILVSTLLGAVSQSYLVPPFFMWWDSYRPRRSLAVPLSYLKPPPAHVSVVSCMRALRARVLFVFSLYAKKRDR